MPSPSFFKPLLSRAISTKFSTQKFTQDFLTVISSLSQNPNNPKTLTALNSLLTQTHLLNPTTSLVVIRGLSSTNKITRSKSILLDLKQRTNLPITFLYSILLQCILKFGTIRDVETVWPEIDGPSITISDFVIWVCRHCGNALEIERIYGRISSSSWRVTSECYVAMIGAMCRNSNPSLGRVILNEMVERGMEADDLTYFAIIRSFCRIGNVLEADLMLRDWRNGRALALDVSIYGSFFYGLCKSGKFREARKLFDKLTTRGGDRGISMNCSSLLKPRRRAIFQLTYSGIISEIMAFETYFRALCSCDRVDEAENLLRVATKKRTVPETCVFTCFIQALFRARRCDHALRFFKVLKKKGYVSGRDICVAVIFGLCDSGRVDDARDLLNEMMSEGFVPTARVGNRVIKSYWKMGCEEKVIELFKGIRADAETYDVMITNFLERGEIEIGISLLDEMVTKKLKAGLNLYGGIVRCLHKCGRVEESNKWLDQMIENGVLVSYDGWESLYDSIASEGAEFWQAMEANYKQFRESEKKGFKRSLILFEETRSCGACKGVKFEGHAFNKVDDDM